MADGKKTSIKLEELRDKAKELIQDQGVAGSDHPAALLDLIEELRAHQLELESQNEEFNRARTETSNSSREHEALYELAPSGYITLSPEGMITHCNATAAALLGAEPDHLQSLSLSSLVASDSLTNYLSAFKGAGQTNDKLTTELELARRDGKRAWVQANVQPDRDQEGAIEQWRLALTDITERKQIEQELQQHKEERAEQKALYRSLVEDHPHFVELFLPDTTIIFANKALAESIGYTPEKLQGMKWIDFVPENEQQRILDALSSFSPKNPIQTNENSFFDWQGKQRWHIWTNRAFFNEQGELRYFQSTGAEITDRKQAEETIENERAYLSAVIDNIGEAIVICDAEGRIARFNETARRLHGLPEQPIPPEQWTRYYDLYHEDGATPLPKEEIPLFRALQGERVLNAEIVVAPIHSRPYCLVCNGQALTDETGKITGAVVAMHDITERKHMEHKLRRERDLSQRYLDTTQTMMLALNEEGRITMINRSGRELLGYAEEEILGCNWFATCLPHPEGMDSVYPVFQRLMAGDQTFEEYFENSVVCKDGTQRLIGWHNACLSGDDGRIVGILCSGEDITEQRQAEEALLESEQRFRQWFESSPISLWEQDFSAVKKRIDEIKTQGVGDLDTYFRQQPELIWELAGLVRVLDVNQASLDLYRATSKEDFFGGITKIFSKESIEGFLQVLKVITAGEQKFITEKEHVTLNGDPIKVQLYWTVAKGHEETFSRILVSIVDITKRNEAKKRLEAAHNKLDTLVQLNADGLMVLNQEGNIVFINPAATELLGRDQEELLGEQFGHPLIAGSNTEIELLSNSGETHVVELRGRQTEWSGQTGLLVSFRDITERKRAEERIYHLAYYDELTGLPNRRLFYDQLKQVAAQSEHFDQGGAMYRVDITRLRDVNDTLGQQAGDDLIREIATRISDGVFEGDTVARLSGGEFLVLAQGRTSADRACDLGQRILERIGWNLELSGRLVYPNVTMGFTLFPQKATDPDTLIKQADLALSEAKKGGHNIREFAWQEDWVSKQFHLEHDLKQALANEEFFLCYQTQVDLRSGRIVGLEALLRWEHPQRGVVSPGEFIPVLENTGMIASADAWVIHGVCKQLGSWQEEGIHAKTSVNLSAQELNNEATLDVVRAALEENGARAESLEVEITETSLMENVGQASKILQTLSAWGVRIALDDFGKGYSSLSYLENLPLNIIKIDKQFIDGLPENKDSVTLVQTIIAMAHNLGKEVLAEGVEHEEQWQKLIELGCDYGQGFLWSRPQRVENLPSMES